MRSWYARNALAGTIVANVLVAAVSWGLAELVVAPTSGGRTVTPIWPPAGLAVALTYIGGYRLLPGIVLGSLLARHLSQSLAARVARWRASQIIQPIVDVRILRALKFDPRARARSRSGDSRAGGRTGRRVRCRGRCRTACYFVAGRLPEERLAYEFVLWWMRDWLGVMVTAPLVFAWVVRAADQRGRGGASAKASRCWSTLFLELAGDVRPVGLFATRERADRVRVLPDRRLGGPAVRPARRGDARGADLGVRDRDRRHAASVRSRRSRSSSRSSCCSRSSRSAR